MNKKNRKLGRIAPLQDLEIIEITDPAEKAALVERIRQAKEALAEDNNGNRKTTGSKDQISEKG